MPSMVAAPARNGPRIGTPVSVGAAADPTAEPTSLPVFFPEPPASMQAICFAVSSELRTDD